MFLLEDVFCCRHLLSSPDTLEHSRQFEPGIVFFSLCSQNKLGQRNKGLSSREIGKCRTQYFSSEPPERGGGVFCMVEVIPVRC